MNTTLKWALGLGALGGAVLLLTAKSSGATPNGGGGELPPSPLPPPPGAFAAPGNVVEVPAAYLYPQGAPSLTAELQPGQLIDSVFVRVRAADAESLQGDALSVKISTQDGRTMIRSFAGPVPTPVFSRGGVIRVVPIQEQAILGNR